MSQKKLSILIADDHEVVREGLGSMISSQADLHLAGEAANGLQAAQMASELRPDVILMDLVMPQMDGVQAILTIKQNDPVARILVLTSYADDEKVFPAIKAGALGYLLKDTPRAQILQAIRDVAQGRAFLHPEIALKVIGELNMPPDLPPTSEPLSAREMETLRLIARGLTNQEIAQRLFLQERTVAKYVGKILYKLHLANRTQAALYALKSGIAKL